jgi:hypothetical protein
MLRSQSLLILLLAGFSLTACSQESRDRSHTEAEVAQVSLPGLKLQSAVWEDGLFVKRYIGKLGKSVNKRDLFPANYEYHGTSAFSGIERTDAEIRTRSWSCFIAIEEQGNETKVISACNGSG